MDHSHPRRLSRIRRRVDPRSRPAAHAAGRGAPVDPPVQRPAPLHEAHAAPVMPSHAAAAQPASPADVPAAQAASTAPAVPLPASRGSAPPIRRASMVPQPWTGFVAGLRHALLYGGRPAQNHPPEPWERAASRRRSALLACIAIAALGAAGLLEHAQMLAGPPALRLLQGALYTLLFAWVAAGFVTAVMGFVVQLRGDRHALSAADAAHRPIRADARTAIIMPICNEQVSSVFAGLRATCESLAATGAAKLFDVYVLSDTSDPALRAAELAAWGRLCEQLGDGARVYYRWRQRRSRRKAGNVADFCRRWGRNYRYMVVLDADSVMSGDCLVSLVRLMEAHPRAGILQTVPQACGLETLHARSQQFAGRVAGRLFTAGMQYWQLGESHYWGHNAIIRVEPFMQHCALAPLPGRGGRSDDIMSHDFVEAALMRRAGYHVWLVPDLQGSYEQQPPNLLTELQRDRRWCQGNLRNARLLAEPGLHPVHRAMLATGAMAYLSAPLWLASVLLGALAWLSGGAAAHAAGRDVPVEMIGLWAGVVTMLALPRVLGVVTLAMKGELRKYGGLARVVKSALLEGALSVLQAPVRMIAHTLFVLAALTGRKLEWKSPPREAEALSWPDALRCFAPLNATVAVLLAAALLGDPRVAVWLLPVALPLLLAAPLSVLTSQLQVGQRARAQGLFLTPEESHTPTVLRRAWAGAQRPAPTPRWPDVVTDPWLFEVVRSSMGPRNTTRGTRGHVRRRLVQHVAEHRDAEAVSAADRMRLMSEPQAIAHLRDRLAAPGSSLRSGEPAWRMPMEEGVM
jgi:membrane glycosyltransferase